MSSALQHFGLGTCGCKECDYYRKHPQLRPRELGGLSSTPLASNEQVFRCFFCKEDFRGVDAENHFGRREGSEPACKIKVPGEFALLQALRNAEDELNRFRAGDSDILRVLWSMRADHAAELRREEEKGYARGLRDARAESETKSEPSKLEFALRGLYWDQVDYLTLNKLGGMNNHWMRAAREALGMDPNDTRVALRNPELRHDSPEIQFADVFAELDKGYPVVTQDAINALWWKVRNQRREISRLHEQRAPKSNPPSIEKQEPLT